MLFEVFATVVTAQTEIAAARDGEHKHVQGPKLNVLGFIGKTRSAVIGSIQVDKYLAHQLPIYVPRQ